MKYTAPVSFEEAMRYLVEAQLLPTTLSSAELSLLSVRIRERAFFSAAVTSHDFLQSALENVQEIVGGVSDRATMRLQLKELLASLDYQPAAGTEGTIQDLSTDKRLNLILDTNVDQARGYGNYQANQDPVILDLWPCQELRRVGPMPRIPRNWMEKWINAGGTFYNGRMIARKDDPIWTRSVAAGGFNRFGTPYPPYDYNSGMRLREISREEAIALGVITENEANPRPAPREFEGQFETEIPSEDLAILERIWEESR